MFWASGGGAAFCVLFFGIVENYLDDDYCAGVCDGAANDIRCQFDGGVGFVQYDICNAGKHGDTDDSKCVG